MKIPTAVKGKNKIRDSKILSLYVNDALTMRQIAERFKISEVRVSKIIYNNSALVKYDQHHEKIKRINHLQRLLVKHPDKMEKKSTLDLIDQVRTEIDGKGSSSEREMERPDSRVIIIREVVKEVPAQAPVPTNRIAEVVDGSPDQTGLVSRSVSVIRE